MSEETTDPVKGNCPYCNKETESWLYPGKIGNQYTWFRSFVCMDCLKKYYDALTPVAQGAQG